MGKETDIRWAKAVLKINDAEDARKAGFDCIQTSLDFLNEENIGKLKDLSMVPEICTSPLPPDAQVTQRGFNIYVWTEYLKKAVSRAAEAGCRKIVWNDGRSRVMPMEGDLSGEKEQVLQFLYLLCEISENYGMSVLIEPLSELRTNFLNTISEVKDFLPLVGRKNISSAISLREMMYIGLCTDDFTSYGSLISHVHMENPLAPEGQRIAPRSDDGYDYGPFVRSLRESGYTGVITLPENADEDSLSFCRSL